MKDKSRLIFFFVFSFASHPKAGFYQLKRSRASSKSPTWSSNIHIWWILGGQMIGNFFSLITKLWFVSIDRHIEIRIPRQHLHLMLIQNYYVVKRTTCQLTRMFNKDQMTELNLLTLYTSTVQLKTSWSGFLYLWFHSTNSKSSDSIPY